MKPWYESSASKDQEVYGREGKRKTKLNYKHDCKHGSTQVNIALDLASFNAHVV